MKNIYLLSLLALVLYSAGLSAQTGSNCANAEAINSLPFTATAVSTLGTSYDTLPCAMHNNGVTTLNYMTGKDYTYAYTPAFDERITINVTSSSTVAGLFVIDSCADAAGVTCLASSFTGFSQPSVTDLQLVAGRTYYILVSSCYPNVLFPSSITFDISVTSCGLPANALFTYIQDTLDVTFVNNSTNAVGYKWLFGDGVPPPFGWNFANTDTAPTHTYPQFGTYTVYLVAYNNCGTSDTTVADIVLVCPGNLPVAAFDTLSVNGRTVAFQNNSVDADSYSWTFGDEGLLDPPTTDANPVHTYDTYGAWGIRLIATNLCGTDTAYGTLNLLCPNPGTAVPAFAYTQDSLVVSFGNISVNAEKFVWYFGDEPFIMPPPLGGDTAMHPIHTYDAYGTYNVTLIATSSCGEVDTLVMPINVICPGSLPVASVDTVYLSGFTASFVNNSTNATSYGWFFGDELIPIIPTDTSANPTHQYDGYGDYVVSLIASNYCGSDTLTDTLSIECPYNVAAVAQFSYIVNDTTVTFTNTSQNSYAYKWLFGDGINNWFFADTTMNPVHHYNGYGTYTVSMIAANCFENDTVVSNIQVVCPYDLPVANFTYSVLDSTVSFTNLSADAVSYKWLFGDGINNWFFADTAVNPVHTYPTSTGTFLVSLVALNACDETDTIYVPINIECPTPFASFNATVNDTALTTENLSINADSYSWTFGDGTAVDTTSSPTHIYLTAGNYNVMLIATNTCGSDTANAVVAVTCTAPVADFTYSGGATITFVNNSSGAQNYIWLFGNGQSSTQQNPVHTYNPAGTYTATLIAINTCSSDTATATFCSANAPTSYGYINSINGKTVNFNSSFSSNLYSVKWFYGDEPAYPQAQGDTIKNPTHTYANYGTYTATLVVFNKCGAYHLSTVSVNIPCPTLSASFNYTRNDKTVYFTNISSNALTYKWFFGDEGVGAPGDASTSPSHTYANYGTYVAKLIAYGHCGKSDTEKVTINVVCATAPVASFMFNASNNIVAFTNLSSNATSYKWLFGDEASTNWSLANTEQHPVHTYPANGSYKVTMVALNSCGSDTAVFHVNVLGIEQIGINSKISCYPNPARDYLNVSSVDLGYGNIEIRLHNMLGQEIYSRNVAIDGSGLNEQIDMSSLTKGVYFVNIITKENTYIGKIVKE